MNDFGFYLPTTIVFGSGKLNEMESILPADFDKILIVTDSVISKKTLITRRLIDLLSSRSVTVFDAIEENPSFETVEDGVRLAKQIGCNLVLGVGGGSSMDAAKGIAVGATNNIHVKEIVKGGVETVDPLPVCCIPTTSGTGSEVTPFAVFSDNQSRTKEGYSSNKIFPVISIIDPELTYSMPSAVVINTGLDVLAHSIESYFSLEGSDLCDTIAIRAIEITLDNLPAAAKGDKEAMNNMAYGSMLAGIAITHASTILPHIMGYPLTVFHKMAHGRASAILLPAFLNFLKEKSLQTDKVKRVEDITLIHGGVRGFLKSLGVPDSLSDYGVSEEELSLFAEKTFVKGDVKITPGDVSKSDIIDMYLFSM